VAKGSNPTTGLTLLWARNPFRGSFNHWQVSREEAGQIFFKRRHGCEKGITIVIWVAIPQTGWCYQHAETLIQLRTICKLSDFVTPSR